VTTVWVFVGLGVVGVGIALVSVLHRSPKPTDLGVVSNQWISEHRLGQGPDTHR
jgi:hypothetical protein